MDDLFPDPDAHPLRKLGWAAYLTLWLMIWAPVSFVVSKLTSRSFRSVFWRPVCRRTEHQWGDDHHPKGDPVCLNCEQRRE
jgi:hypothetical protein